MVLRVAKSFNELIAEAREAEKNSELEKAAKIYENAIQLTPHAEQPYSRLMIIYRKLALYEEELKIIRKGIKVFQDLYQKKSRGLIEKNRAAVRLSNALAKSLGQKGEKTKHLFYPEPIPKWMKRQQIVEKKIGIN